MIVRKNKSEVTKKIKKGEFKNIFTILPNIVDDMFETLDKKLSIFKLIDNTFTFFKAHEDGFNNLVFLLSMINAKSKKMFAITDVASAIQNPYTLNKIGVTIIDEEKDDIMTEGNVRNFINKLNSDDQVKYFNKLSKEFIELNDRPTTHILDCVKLPVNLENTNYEKSTVAKIESENIRGYKLAVVRGITNVGGIIEAIKDDTIKTHDLTVSKDFVLGLDCLKSGDTLLMDRGFLDIDFVSKLIDKDITVIVPVKKNMNLYKEAIKLAKIQDNWVKHPNKKRKGQEITLVENLGETWLNGSETIKKPIKFKIDRKINACVIRLVKENYKDLLKENESDDKYIYIVIITTNESHKASDIVLQYEQRPEIEEDFRQLKDIWGLCNFTSTKYNYIICHIVMMLIGYNMFNLYKSTDEGRICIGRSMHNIIKKEELKKVSFSEIKYLIVTDTYYGVYDNLEFMDLYADCSIEIRNKIKPLLS